MRQPAHWTLCALLGPLTVGSLATGCGEPRIQTRDYAFVVRATTSPRVPLKGAAVLYQGNVLGETNQDGLAELSLVGTEGSLHRIEVTCPPGYQGPLEPIELRLRTLGDGEHRSQYDVSCQPLQRNVVVVVRTNHANLPVHCMGQQIGQTDVSGAAHVLLEGPPGEKYELVLDTSAKPELKPASPTLALTIPEHDDIAVFSQSFATPPKPRPRRTVKAPPKRTGPVRITNQSGLRRR